MNIEKYGFEKLNTETLIEGICMAYLYQKEDLVIAEIEEPLTHQLSEDMVEENALGIARIIQMHFNCRYLLLVWNEKEEVRLIAFSDEKRVRAFEFLDYVISDFALVKGNAKCANGKISTVYLNVQMAQTDFKDAREYLLARCQKYFEHCDWIDAAKYGEEKVNEIKDYVLYQKKKIPWAYVKTTDLAPVGEQIELRSLENESGILIEAGEDIYIMIGARGEVYDIKKTKFERTYEATDEELDIFEQMLEFLPEIQIAKTKEYIMLDSYAKLCYPKTDAKIYAKQIDKRTKIFPVQEGQEYFLGRPGDFMAVRRDDLKDIYIIQQDIFYQTYEAVKEQE